MPESDAVSSEGLRPSNRGPHPRPLHTENSPVSLSLLMVLCTDDEICKAFAI